MSRPTLRPSRVLRIMRADVVALGDALRDIVATFNQSTAQPTPGVYQANP